jgi:hypothetical protein
MPRHTLLTSEHVFVTTAAMQAAELPVDKASSEDLLALLQRLPEDITSLSITVAEMPALPGDQQREERAAAAEATQAVGSGGMPSMLLGWFGGHQAQGASLGPGLAQEAMAELLISERRAEQQAFTAALCQKLLGLRRLQSLHLQFDQMPLLLDGCGEQLLRGLRSTRRC